MSMKCDCCEEEERARVVRRGGTPLPTHSMGCPRGIELMQQEQALRILDALEGPTLALTVQRYTLRGGETYWSLVLRRKGEPIECHGSSLRDALGQVASVLLVEKGEMVDEQRK